MARPCGIPQTATLSISGPLSLIAMSFVKAHKTKGGQMKKFIIFLMVFWLFLPIANAAYTLPINGIEFVRGTSAPAYEEIEFVATLNEIATVKVINGGTENDEKERVSSSVITINGRVLFDSSNFNQQVEQVSKTIRLNSGVNKLGVNLKSKPGGKISVSITPETGVVETLPSSGGIVTVSDGQSAIFGTSVNIPQESVPAGVGDVEIAIIATNVPQPLPLEFFQAGTAVNIESNVKQFNETTPIQFTIPYNDKNNDGVIDGTSIPESKVGVRYFNENTAIWEDIPIIKRDLVKNTVTIETDHFSNYVTFVSKYIKPPNTTPVVPEGKSITINGSLDDWYSAGLIANGIDDPQGDLLTNLVPSPYVNDYDIKSVYTAVDSQYAYLMIETYGNTFPNDILLDLAVDFAPGEKYWVPFADLGITFHVVGFRQDGKAYIYTNSGDWILIESARGTAFEMKIPISLLTNYAGYFNVINAKMYYSPGPPQAETWNNLCDQVWFGSYVNFRLDHRTYENQPSKSKYQLAVELVVEEQVINEDVITQLTLYGPLENSPSTRAFAIPSEAKFSSYKYYSGQWKDSPAGFSPGPMLYDASVITSMNEINALPAGTYRVTVVDNLGRSFEREKYFSGAKEPPTVTADAIVKFFDTDGNLHCYWESPNLKNTGFSTNHGTSNIRVSSWAADKMLSYVQYRVPINYARIIIPNNLLAIVNGEAGAERLEIDFHNRSSDSCNRYYSESRLLILGQPQPSGEWLPPYTDDWSTNGLDLVRWYPAYYSNPTSLTIQNDEINIETFSGEEGEASYFSKFFLSGDFDIQSDFIITSWPERNQTGGNGKGELDFQVGYGGSNPRVLIGQTRINSNPGPTRYYYSGFYNGVSWVWGTIVGTTDMQGKFRIVRQGTSILTYYYASGWVLLGNFSDNSNILGSPPAKMILTNQISGANPYYNDIIPIEAGFSGFKITTD
jgi:hypothetical protein